MCEENGQDVIKSKGDDIKTQEISFMVCKIILAAIVFFCRLL